MIASQFINEGFAVSTVLNCLQLSNSTYNYKSKDGQKGRPVSQWTKTQDGLKVKNEKVVKEIEELLSKEFVDYGYLKVTHWLRQEMSYIINPKKVYRLMAQAGLLNKKSWVQKSKRNWVKELVPDTEIAFEYLEVDIKYFPVAGQRRNALTLTFIDVRTRWMMGQYTSWSILKEDVIALFDDVFRIYDFPKKIYVRNDNGSQFIANNVQEYFSQKGIHQEFCKPATPEQNAHIESYHSIVEKVVCRRNEFEDLEELQNTLNRFVRFYNFERIHSGVGYQSPYKFLLEKNVDMGQLDLQNVLNCKYQNSQLKV